MKMLWIQKIIISHHSVMRWTAEPRSRQLAMNCMLQAWYVGEMLKATIGHAHSSRKQVAPNLFCWSFILSAEKTCINRGVLSLIA